MPYGLYMSADGADVQARRLEVIANNLANVDTVGYKRDVASFQAAYAEAIEQGLVDENEPGVNQVGGGVWVMGVATDFAPGPMKRTGIPTDVAIGGDGFFQIQKPDGETLLSRAGNFTVDGVRNQLVTQARGDAVLSEDGAPLLIDPTLGQIQISDDGTVSQIDSTGQSVLRGRLAIVEPDSLQQLQKVGQNLFRAEGATTLVTGDRRVVRQHYLEGSGVNPTFEMMNMIETSRLFEANIRLIQNQDEMISSLISSVLQV